MRILLCLSLCFAVLLSGCASIVCGSDKRVFISSVPTGADFTIENARGYVTSEGVTPATVSLKRGRGWFKAGDYKITFSKEGCRQTTFPMEQGLETGWYIVGNLFFGGLIGIVIVDPLTGAMWDIQDVRVSLDCD
ncbi:MAG: hypothetical protein HWN68_21025 [Desulfobacterales bacterium]|nr:hypothetical protein [Desulfobacterales bacterium]